MEKKTSEQLIDSLIQATAALTEVARNSSVRLANLEAKIDQRANTADAWKLAFILLAGLILSLALIIFGLLTFTAITI
jgi:hypothetical protein